MEDELLIAGFLRGDLNNDQQKFVEGRIASDKEFSDLYHKERELFNAYDGESWNFEERDTEEVAELTAFFKSEEFKKFEGLIKAAKPTQEAPTKVRRINMKMLVVAASIAFLIGFFWVSTTGNGTTRVEDSYMEYLNASEIPSMIHRSVTEDNSLAEAENYFKQGDFEKALPVFEKALEVTKDSSNLYLYTAVSYTQLKKYDDANRVLDQLISSDLLDSSKGYWYKALNLLLSGEKEEGIGLLNEIVKNNYFKHLEATALLKKLV